MITIVKGLKLPCKVIQGNIEKTRAFVRANAALVRQYGRTIVGSDDRVTSIRKSALAAATGHMSVGASRTLAIQLSFGRKDQTRSIQPDGVDTCMAPTC